MRLIEFPEQTVVYAKGQPIYDPMPAHRVPNSDGGEIICCWKLSWRERLRVLWHGVLWHHILTFSQPLQPQKLSAANPFKDQVTR